ncbi:hypothetical protein F4604DRAFT_552325 [Suillus subluteus]|nr:hypothetical protein F4604DRAFT_552325 [Suillus subluteus]
MSSSTQPSDIIIGRTFGALFIGVTIAAVLFGLSCVQAFVYFQTHRDTGTTFYKLVICLWILDALHLAFITHCVYYYLVSSYANISALMDVVWSFKLQILMEVLIIQGVHSLYLYRIWIISQGRSRILPIIVGIVIMSNSGVAIALIWAIYQCSMFSDLDKIDTDSLITRLMVYIINTGCLTSMCSMAAIITCAVMPTNFIFVAIEFLLAELYVNSYLALLNARYYTEVNTDTNNSDTFHNRHGVYRPELHVRALDDEEELQISRKDVFKHLDDAVHPSPSVKEPTLAVITEMNSFSSV